MPLNIDLQQIFLHMLNLVFLFAALYFLLYKPVKDFMAKRMEHYAGMEKDAQQMLSDAENTKAAYEQRLSQVETEVAQIKSDARADAAAKAEEQMRLVHEESERIIAKAKRTAFNERAKIIEAAQDEIADMVADAAEKLVASSTESAYDSFLVAAEGSGADA